MWVDWPMARMMVVDGEGEFAAGDGEEGCRLRCEALEFEVQG